MAESHCVTFCVSFGLRNGELAASLDQPRCFGEIASIDDVVPPEHARRAMPTDFHGYFLHYAAPHHVSNRRAPEVVKVQPHIAVVLFAVLALCRFEFSEPGTNT